jgi:hypothetical protein
MHQMRISTSLESLFSDAQAEKVENPKKKKWKLYMIDKISVVLTYLGLTLTILVP